MENMWEPHSGLWGLSWGPAWNDDTTDWATGLLSAVSKLALEKKEPEKSIQFQVNWLGFVLTCLCSWFKAWPQDSFPLTALLLSSECVQHGCGGTSMDKC